MQAYQSAVHPMETCDEQQDSQRRSQASIMYKFYQGGLPFTYPSLDARDASREGGMLLVAWVTT